MPLPKSLLYFLNRTMETPGYRFISWMQALRLPFYPMAGMGYTLGASLMVPFPELWGRTAYWQGLMMVFSVEALTVFLNDL